MKVGLLSDTHGWLDPALHQWFAGVALILHAGDVGSAAVLDELRGLAPVIAVRGNVDGGAWAQDLPLDTVAEVGALRVAMLHIAGNPRRPRPEARALIQRERPDLLLVGHSHIPIIERRDGVLWVNPGAAGRHGFHDERTAMILNLDESGRTIDFIRLGPRARLRPPRPAEEPLL